MINLMPSMERAYVIKDGDERQVSVFDSFDKEYKAVERREVITSMPHIKMSMNDDDCPQLEIDGKDQWPLSEWGFQSLAKYLKLPHNYARSVAPSDLAEYNFVELIKNKTENSRIKVTVNDGVITQIIDANYVPIDRYKLLDVARRIMHPKEEDQFAPVCRIVNSDGCISFTIISPSTNIDVSTAKCVGDIMRVGIEVISNDLSCQVRPLIWRLQCLNGVQIIDNSWGGFKLNFTKPDREGQLHTFISGINNLKSDVNMITGLIHNTQRFELTNENWPEISAPVSKLLGKTRFNAIENRLGFGEEVVDIKEDGPSTLYDLLNEVTFSAHHQNLKVRNKIERWAGNFLTHQPSLN